MATETQIAWLLGRDTGLSSKTIFAVMVGIESPDPQIPFDPADLGRCLRLLSLFPEWKSRLGEVAEKYPAWTPLVREWHSLAALYYEELPLGLAPKCYAAMKALREEPTTA